MLEKVVFLSVKEYANAILKICSCSGRALNDERHALFLRLFGACFECPGRVDDAHHMNAISVTEWGL